MMTIRIFTLNHTLSTSVKVYELIKGFSLFTLSIGLAITFLYAHNAMAASQPAPGIAAIVNDEPISQFDISQRIKLNKVLKEKPGTRKQALEELVEEHLQRQEAKRLRIPVTTKEVNTALKNMFEAQNSTVAAFDKRLKKVGVKPSIMRERIKALLAWRRILSRKFGKLVDLDEQDIDRAHQRAKKNSRPAKRFYILQQIILPFDGALDQFSIQGRKIEAKWIIDNFKGCRSTKRISKGIYNVQIRNRGPIPVEQLQAKLRKLLRKAGPGKLLPPNITRNGIELLAFCSIKTVAAQEITREQVRAGLANQQFGLISKRHLRDLKRDAIIDYR